MDDESDFLKSKLLSLHKITLGKNYQPKTLKDRVNDFNNIRRETRNSLMSEKRNMDKNMMPIHTPNKRLKMLEKWKAIREKRKQEEKLKRKPLFKVCHVPDKFESPNLKNVKTHGKNASNITTIKSKIVEGRKAGSQRRTGATRGLIPKEEKALGKTASNINARKKVTAPNLACTPPKKNRKNEKVVTMQKRVGPSAAILENNNNKYDKTLNRNINTRSKSLFVEIDNPKYVSADREKARTKSRKQSVRMITESLIKTPNKYRKPDVKSVRFNLIEIDDSDDDVFCSNVDHRTPKKVTKKYNKTPKIGQKLERIASIKLEEVLIDEKEMKMPHSLRNTRNSRISLEKDNLTANSDKGKNVTYAAQNLNESNKKTPRKGQWSGYDIELEHSKMKAGQDNTNF